MRLAYLTVEDGAATSEPFQRSDVHFQLNNSSLALPLTPLTASSFGTWPMYDQNSLRTGANNLERTLAFRNVSLLSLSSHFPFTTYGNAPIAGSAAVANGTAYFGTMAGNLYALNVTSGSVNTTSNTSWISNTTGIVPYNCSNNSNPNNSNQPSGVISTPALWGNLVIVGTGDSVGTQGYGWVRAYYASGNHLAGTLAWSLNLSQHVKGSWAGAYVWSSPVIWRGDVYVGFASGCDDPLVQGALFQLNATTGAILDVADMVPNGQIGASIWSSPSIDTANNTIWVTTGNNNRAANQPLSSSIVELNLSNVSQVLGHWQVPGVSGQDRDFGAGATLTSGGQTLPLAIATNKNGVVYAINRSDVTAGPVWQEPLAISGAVAPASAADGMVYIAGGPVHVSYFYTGLPPGCVTQNTSILSCTPSSQATGFYRVEIRGVDAAGHVGYANTSITVAPARAFQVTQFSTDHPSGVTLGARFTLTTSVTNVGAGIVSYTYTGLPPGCSSQNSPSIGCTSTAAGVYSIDVFANDSTGADAEAVLTQGVIPETGVVSVQSAYSGPPTVPSGDTIALIVSMSTTLAEGPGSITALYPSNGTVKWSHGAPGTFYAGPSFANGLVIDAAIWSNYSGTTLEVLDAANGDLLAHYNVTGMVTGEPVIADGRIYFGTTPSTFSGTGKFYALNIPLKALLILGFRTTGLGLNLGPSITFGGSPPVVAVGGSPPYNCFWDFGDNSQYPSCYPVNHQYTKSGQFVITLNVSDQVDATSTATAQLFTRFGGCGGGPFPCPVWGSGGIFTLAPCSPGSPLQCIQPRTVSFDSYDSGGSPPYSYLWAFGDGHTSTDATPVYTYASAGEYLVTLTITDSENQQGTLSFDVTVT